MDAAEHHIRGCRQAADLVGLGLAVHAPDPRPQGNVATRPLEFVDDARKLQRLRCAVVHLGAIRDEAEHDLLRFCGVFGPEHVHSVRLEGGGGPSHAGVVCHRPVATPARLIEVCLEFHHLATLSLG